MSARRDPGGDRLVARPVPSSGPRPRGAGRWERAPPPPSGCAGSPPSSSSGAWRAPWSACSPGWSARVGGGGPDPIAALTADSAELYRSLADADAMATSGYVAGGREPTAVRGPLRRRHRPRHRPAGRRRRRLPGSGPPPPSRPSCRSTPGSSRPPARSTGRGCRSARPTWAARRSSCAARSCPAAEELRRTQAAELDAAHERGVAIPFAVLRCSWPRWPGSSTSRCASAAGPTARVSVGLVAGAVALVAALAWWVGGDDGARTGGSTPRSATAPPRPPSTTRAPPSCRRAAARA